MKKENLEEANEICKKAASLQRISELFIKQLRTIFKEVTPNSLELKNGRKVTIYHFAFASNKATAKKIASSIIGKE